MKLRLSSVTRSDGLIVYRLLRGDGSAYFMGWDRYDDKDYLLLEDGVKAFHQAVSAEKAGRYGHVVSNVVLEWDGMP